MSNRLRLFPAVLGGAVGAAAAFFLDPQSGRRRRIQAVDRSSATLRRATRLVQRGGRFAAATAEGKGRQVIHAATGTPRPVANDETLADRVRSELFRDAGVPKGAININVERGVVVLRGQVQRPDEVRSIESRVRGIAGVEDVENLLHPAGTPAPMHH